MTKNTKELWENLWAGDSKELQEHKFNLKLDENGTVWRSIRKSLDSHFKDLRKLNVVELGAGRGSISALMAPLVNKVTMIDFSDAALQKSKEFYQFLGLANIEYINADALSLPRQLCDQYDISMSFGLAEHFADNERAAVIKSHFDMLKESGLSFISVPNRHCLPYQIWKHKRSFFNKWNFGLEIPYSRAELKGICNEIGITNYFFIGSSFLASFDFILPFSRWKRSLSKRLINNYFARLDKIKPQVATPLDAIWGYALVLCGVKK